MLNLLPAVLLSMIVVATGFIKLILAIRFRNKMVTIEKVTYARCLRSLALTRKNLPWIYEVSSSLFVSWFINFLHRERNGSSIMADNNSTTDHYDMGMEDAELVMAEAKEAWKASERTRPSRQLIHAFCWGLEGVWQDAKWSLIQTHESLLSWHSAARVILYPTHCQQAWYYVSHYSFYSSVLKLLTWQNNAWEIRFGLLSM